MGRYARAGPYNLRTGCHEDRCVEDRDGSSLVGTGRSPAAGSPAPGAASGGAVAGGAPGSAERSPDGRLAVLRRAVARAWRTRDGMRRTPLWIELIVVVWLLWIYDAINNLAPIRIALAHHDAGDLLHLEKLLHIDPEAGFEHWMAAQHTLASIVSNYYDNAHFAVTFTLVGLLWLKLPDVYRPLRNSLVLVNLVAMTVFWVFPTAPPRLFDPSVYPDIVARTHAFGSWHSGALATAANQLAAMPSLHIAWACWSALAIWRIFGRRRWAALAWLYPVATALAVMSTGNHWLLDVLAGALTLAVSAFVADRWQGWWTSREARRALDRHGSLARFGGRRQA